MGLLERIGVRQTAALQTIDVTPRRLHPVDQELVSLTLASGEVSAAIERAMRKSMTAASYIAFDNVDDQGGYFGTEFDIRTTAARLKGLYTREPWIYTTATKIAKTLASVPLKVYSGSGPDAKEIPNHPVKKLLDMGSPMQSQKELRWNENLDLMLGGNYFLILEENLKTVAGIAPVELVQLNYSQDYQRIDSIDVFSMGAGVQKAQRFPIEQVVHVKLPNPFQPLYGMSPFAAAARPILLDRYKNEFEMAFYLRGATSAGVVETTEDLSQNRFRRLVRSFEEAFTGRANWWRTLFLPKGSKFVKSSLTMAEMQHLEGLKENRLTILAVLGIPPSQVGIVTDVNRATAEQQERNFWADTIVPLAEFCASGWNQSHVVKQVYKGKIEVRPDFTGIEAVEGFLAMKAEKAKAMEPYYLIDEIRERVWKDEPLPDGKGQRLVAEVKSSGGPGFPPELALGGKPSTTKAALPTGFEIVCLVFPKDKFTQTAALAWAESHGYSSDNCADGSDSWRLQQASPDVYDLATMKDHALEDGVRAEIAERIDTEGAKAAFLASKAAATGSQNRIESKLGAALARAVDAYINDLLTQAKEALLTKKPVRTALENRASERLEAYVSRSLKTYEAALDRGFSAATSMVKIFAEGSTKRARFTTLSETDQQAVDVLKERTEDGQRKVLRDRLIERFRGLDANRTEAVMGIIEDGERAGKPYEQIAREIRDTYGEAYQNQARTIVRTEVLSAVSQGLAWNHGVLGEVFTEVQKEWMHQGDAGVNPDARESHADLDGEIVTDSWSYVNEYGETITLAYPRDPSAPAGEVINCRCTMLSVIPEGATSNAEDILDAE